jgi:GNAT superfamily N-acetyltransferase
MVREGVEIRRAHSDDALACGRIIFSAFKHAADRCGTLCDFPSERDAIRIAGALIADPSVYAVVAHERGRIVGSNFLLEGDRVRAVGPTSVDPAHQNHGIGRALMRAVLDRARDAEAIRLVADLYNLNAVHLYATLGFTMSETLLLMRGAAAVDGLCGYEVRPMREDDVAACGRLCRAVYGFERSAELEAALLFHEPYVVARGGRITGYLSAADNALASHGVAERIEDLEALVAGICTQLGRELAFHVPMRENAFVAWCVAAGFKPLKASTLMTLGRFEPPHGMCLPSAYY